ncbi:MAG TPA: hypothetical protein VG711_08155 [Phycisphaerales bacterium]|nr:hypothetical protein [Phycisphaerales bacterium]
MKLARVFVVALSGLALTGAVQAQSFNIDIGNATGGTGGPAPSNAFGAAAGQVGFWNNMTTQTSMLLNDLGNLATLVTLTRSTTAGNTFGFDNTGTTGDFGLLMDDGQDLSASTGLVSFTFTGLANGTYSVYTYAWAPDVPGSDKTDVSVVGAVQGMQVVGGNLPANNTFALGITHALHTVTVTNGMLTIQVDGDAATSSFGTINGIQLVGNVPAPGALALLGMAGITGRRRRRI